MRIKVTETLKKILPSLRVEEMQLVELFYIWRKSDHPNDLCDCEICISYFSIFRRIQSHRRRLVRLAIHLRMHQAAAELPFNSASSLADKFLSA